MHWCQKQKFMVIQIPKVHRKQLFDKRLQIANIHTCLNEVKYEMIQKEKHKKDNNGMVCNMNIQARVCPYIPYPI